MGLASGPDAIVQPQVSALVSRPEAVVEPRATALMADAFRQGFITTDDVMERLSERNQLKRKADVMQLREATSPDAQEARRLALKAGTDRLKAESENAALMAAANKAKTESELAKNMLGPNGQLVESAYASVGRLIPLRENPDLPGTKLPDVDQIARDLKQINQYQQFAQTEKTKATGWKEQLFEDNVGGQKITRKKYVNAFTGDVQDNLPMSRIPTFDDFLSMQPGTSLVTPLSAPQAPVPVPTAAPAPTVDTPETQRLRAQAANAVGQDALAVQGLDADSLRKLAAQPGAPQSQPTPQGAALVEPTKPVLGQLPPGVTSREIPKPEDITPALNAVASRYAQNKVVVDAAAAGTAYSAAQEVMNRIQPDGSYVPNMPILPKQADFNLMVNYAKILDPTSVVREGEIALLKQTSSAFDRLVYGMTGQQVADYVNTVAGRQMFTAPERRSFAQLLKSAYANRLEAVKPVREASAAALQALGASPEQIEEALPFHPIGLTPPQSQPQPGAVPAANGQSQLFVDPKTGRTLRKIGPGQYEVVK